VVLADGVDLAAVANIQYAGYNRRKVLEYFRTDARRAAGLGIALIVSFRGTNPATIGPLAIPGGADGMTVNGFVAANDVFRIKSDDKSKITAGQLLQAFSPYVFIVWQRLYDIGALPMSGFPGSFRIHCSAFLNLPLNDQYTAELREFTIWFSRRLSGNRYNEQLTNDIINMQIASRAYNTQTEVQTLRTRFPQFFM